MLVVDWNVSEERRARIRENSRRYYEKNKETIQAKNRAHSLRYYYANLETVRAKMRARYAANREAQKKRSNEYHAANRDERLVAIRRSAMWRKYKRTLEDYEFVLAEQGGGCAICGQPPSDVIRSGAVRRLAWDHDHFCCPGPVSCGVCVRGLLCTKCNVDLGKVEQEKFKPHLDYLARWEEKG